MAVQTEMQMTTLEEERFTVSELSKKWKLGRNTITRMLQDEQGVFKYESKTGSRRRSYVTLRIPASVSQPSLGREVALKSPTCSPPSGAVISPRALIKRRAARS